MFLKRYALPLLALSLLLVLTLSTDFSLTDADSAEFVSLGVVGGISHPPGYPLYILLLQFTHLISGSVNPVVSFTFVSCLCVMFTFIFTALMVAELEPKQRQSSYLITALMFLSWPFIKIGTTTEPFALNLLLTSLLLWLCFARKVSDRITMVLIGLLYGFGACNHHTFSLTMLVLLFVIWRAFHEGGVRIGAQALTFLAGGFVLGMTPYLVVLQQRVQVDPSWGDWNKPISGFFTHFLRREYGTFNLASGASSDTEFGLHYLGKSFFVALREFGLILLALAPFALVRKKQRAVLLVLAVCFLMTGPLFFSRFNLPDIISSRDIASRFIYYPLYFALILIVLFLLRLMNQRGKGVVVTCCLAMLVLTINNWPKGVRIGQYFYQTYLESLPQLLEKPAYIINFDDPGLFGSYYLKYAAKTYKDVEIISHLHLNSPWYRERLQRQFGLPKDADLPAIVEKLLERGNVYLERPHEKGVWGLGHFYFYGPFARVLPKGIMPPQPVILLANNIRYFATLFQKEKNRYYLTPWETSIAQVSLESIATIARAACSVDDERVCGSASAIFVANRAIFEQQHPQFLLFPAGPRL